VNILGGEREIPVNPVENECVNMKTVKVVSYTPFDGSTQ